MEFSAMNNNAPPVSAVRNLWPEIILDVPAPLDWAVIHGVTAPIRSVDRQVLWILDAVVSAEARGRIQNRVE